MTASVSDTLASVYTLAAGMVCLGALACWGQPDSPDPTDSPLCNASPVAPAFGTVLYGHFAMVPPPGANLQPPQGGDVAVWVLPDGLGVLRIKTYIIDEPSSAVAASESLEDLVRAVEAQFTAGLPPAYAETSTAGAFRAGPCQGVKMESGGVPGAPPTTVWTLLYRDAGALLECEGTTVNRGRSWAKAHRLCEITAESIRRFR